MGNIFISSVSSLSFLFLSSLSLSLISSTISSITFLPFSGRRRKMTHKGWRVVKPQHNQSMTGDVCDQKGDGPTNPWVVHCLSWKTIGILWFGRDYWHSGRAVNSITQPIMASIPIARGWITRLWCQPTKFAIPAILNFVSTLNFISIHSPSTYKLSMIRFVHKVHFDVDF